MTGFCRVLPPVTFCLLHISRPILCTSIATIPSLTTRTKNGWLLEDHLSPFCCKTPEYSGIPECFTAWPVQALHGYHVHPASISNFATVNHECVDCSSSCRVLRFQCRHQVFRLTPGSPSIDQSSQSLAATVNIARRPHHYPPEIPICARCSGRQVIDFDWPHLHTHAVYV
jgi:hypothetical protein